MHQVVSKVIPSEHYEADACVVWCFDFRFRSLLDEMVGQLGYEKYDLINVAGGARDLASGGSNARAYLAGQIEKSLSLHKTQIVDLVVHFDCGAYGKKFENRWDEIAFLKSELDEAEKNTRHYIDRLGYPVEIKKFIADFGGLYEV